MNIKPPKKCMVCAKMIHQTKRKKKIKQDICSMCGNLSLYTLLKRGFKLKKVGRKQ